MKKYLGMFVSCWCVGFIALILQTVVDPLVLNNITGILENFQPQTATTLIVLLLIFLLSSALAIAASAGDMIFRQRISANMCTDWSLRLMRKVLFTHNSFLLENDSEKIVARISRDTAAYAEYKMSSFLEIPLVIIGLLVSLYMMFCGSFPFLEYFGLKSQQGNTLLGLIIISMAPLHVSFLLYNKKIMEIEQKQADAYEKEYQISSESLRGITDIRASNAFTFVLQRLFSVFTDTKNNRIKLCSIFAVFQNITGLVWAITQVVVLAVSAWLISHPNSGFGFKDYMGFSVLCGMFNQYVTRCVQVVLAWQRARPAGKRVHDLDCLQDDFSDSVGTNLNSYSHNYLFNKIDFCIDSNIKILDSVNVKISKGEHVALVGPSGCGKSTLLKMVMRHLSPSSGEVRFGEQNIEKINFPDYSRCVTYVSQKPFIFSGSIYDNIFVGRKLNLSGADLLHILDDVVLTADLMRKALDMPACSVYSNCQDKNILLREYLLNNEKDGETSEQKLFERLNESGKREKAILAALQFKTSADGQGLSGGQMAKIALARALVGSPEVLLLDEVTAPLDELSQEKVTKMLAEKCKGKTIISISHRIPAVRGMDRILVMDAGKIVQDGTYDGLLKQPGLFSLLVARETGVMPEKASGNEFVLSADQRGIMQALSLSPVFAGIASENLKSLAEKSEIVHVSANDFLFHQGDPGTEMYVIMSGVIQIGNNLFQAGCSFGEIALFGDIPRTLDVTAKEDTELICLSKEAVLDVAKANPDMLIELLRSVAKIAARETANRFK